MYMWATFIKTVFVLGNDRTRNFCRTSDFCLANRTEFLCIDEVNCIVEISYEFAKKIVQDIAL